MEYQSYSVDTAGAGLSDISMEYTLSKLNSRHYHGTATKGRKYILSILVSSVIERYDTEQMAD